jgi:uncharacterized protein GlcG (DUF336 family)
MARVTRTEIDLELALRLCAAAIERAEADGALVSVAVVDAGGHLVAFQRMDAAEIAGPTLATDKAFTAVAHRSSTESLSTAVVDGGELVGMYAAGAGRYIAFGGGVPLWSEGRVVAGVGVSGGSAAQDVAAAHAAAAVFDAAAASTTTGDAP